MERAFSCLSRVPGFPGLTPLLLGLLSGGCAAPVLPRGPPLASVLASHPRSTLLTAGAGSWPRSSQGKPGLTQALAVFCPLRLASERALALLEVTSPRCDKGGSPRMTRAPGPAVPQDALVPQTGFSQCSLCPCCASARGQRVLSRELHEAWTPRRGTPQSTQTPVHHDSGN